MQGPRLVHGGGSRQTTLTPQRGALGSYLGREHEVCRVREALHSKTLRIGVDSFMISVHNDLADTESMRRHAS